MSLIDGMSKEMHKRVGISQRAGRLRNAIMSNVYLFNVHVLRAISFHLSFCHVTYVVLKQFMFIFVVAWTSN